MYSEPHTFRSIVIRNVPNNMLPTGAAEIVDWFKATDITRVKDADCLDAAEIMLEEAEAYLTEKVPKQFDAIKLLARAEGRVARLLAEKKNKAFPHYPDLPSITQELEKEVSEYISKGTTKSRTDEQKKSDEVVCFVRALCMYVDELLIGWI